MPADVPALFGMDQARPRQLDPAHPPRPEEPVIVYISIGNSDNKLTQAQWADFVTRVDIALLDQGVVPGAAVRARHGNWRSLPDDLWQNACWCVDLDSDFADPEELKSELRNIAVSFGQAPIAWAEAPITEFIGAAS